MSISSTETTDQNRSEIPTQTVTNTGMGNLIAKCVLTGQNLNVPEFTTLNEKYGILADQSLGVKNGRDFFLKYFGVGIRGSNCTGVDSRGVSAMKVNQHQPIDMDLFVPIPMACRPINSDFDNVNRSKYRLRVVEDINGVAYAFYYLKLIDFSNYDPRLLKITRDENGNEIPVPFIPVKDDLFSPTPVDFTSEGSVPTSNVYINNSAILDCTLSQNDLQELRNACLIKFNDEAYASINEVSLAYGIDTQTDGQIGQGGVIRYTEVLSAIVAHYICERDARSARNNTEVRLAFDHGASEPMLVHTTPTTP